MQIEKMQDFFEARIDEYEAHMLNVVEGCQQGYAKMAELLPPDTANLLDLGCGTGLELDEIFSRHPAIHVTGIDLTKAMLHKLMEKHPDKDLELIHASYFDYDFGKERFDAAVSFETMHHFSKEKKLLLYTRIYEAIKPGGVYIECDYMVDSQSEEDFFASENQRIRKEQQLAENEFYHFDTPCSVDNQKELFLRAGFKTVQMVWRVKNTVLITAWR